MNMFPYDLFDLTHSLDEHAPTWDGQCGFHKQITNDYGQIASFVPFAFRVHQLTLRAGMGTHIDTPAHCIPGTLTVDAIDLGNLIAPCSVINISQDVYERSTVSVTDIKNYEKRYGTIPLGSIVMMRSDWDIYWNKPEKYRNNNLFPSFSLEAAEYLLEREIVGIGVDTPSPDRPADGYPVHALLLGANKYIIENVANLKALPEQGAYVGALPLKIKDGVEAPVRLIGFVQKKS